MNDSIRIQFEVAVKRWDEFRISEDNLDDLYKLEIAQLAAMEIEISFNDFKELVENININFQPDNIPEWDTALSSIMNVWPMEIEELPEISLPPVPAVLSNTSNKKKQVQRQMCAPAHAIKRNYRIRSVLPPTKPYR